MKKIFLTLAIFVMAICASAQKNQYFWYQGNLMLGSPIAQIDSVTFGEGEQVDTLHIMRPRTIIKTMHDTVYITIHDTVCPDDIPEGALKGVFSVAADKKVRFSKGNLQYQASTTTWRFADHQYDFVGHASKGNVYINETKCNNANISSTYSGWIDLFGFSTTTGNYGVSSSTTSSLYTGSFVDWGTLFNDEWYTLSVEEWKYLLNTRANASMLRGVARVNGANGVVLLPDEWQTPDGITFQSGVASNYGEDYYKTVNDFTEEQWTIMEQNGAVFLPAGSRRSGTSVDNTWGFGLYWTSSAVSTSKSRVFCFNADFMRAGDEYGNYLGMNVRLIQEVE